MIKILKTALRFSMLTGLSISVIYRIMSRHVNFSDSISIPVSILSIILMLIGIAYHGWCFGRGKNPYKPD